MRPLLAITKALADSNRVRILCALHRHGELCVCQIQELLMLAASTTSKHLSLLAAAGLVDVRKDGRWAYYRLSAESAPENGAEVLGWLCRQGATQAAIRKDQQRLDEILSLTPEELCQRQASEKRCCSSAPETPVAAKSPKGTRGR